MASSAARLLVIMGSGETAPTMVKAHRGVFERVRGPAVLLDTPYGFQENAEDISRRAVDYFAASVGQRVDVVPWRRRPETVDLTAEQALTALRTAGWVFAGPGSPTYALRQWQGTPIPDLLVDKLTGPTGGVVVFASAAAVTLGSHAVPVYEIYKAGFDPFWAPGLDLFERVTGVPAVVIPHYDNAEGGHHDTRYCYLGERRLARLETELPDGTLVLGVDEHTACVIDLDEQTMTVLGNGGVTVRRPGPRQEVFPAGTTAPVSVLRTAATAAAAAVPVAAAAPAASPELAATTSLRATADGLDGRFRAALQARDVPAALTALLELEQVLVDWSADTLTSDERDHTRRILRAMVVRIGEYATVGARDPRAVLGPYVEIALAARTAARTAGDYRTGDAIRDALTGAGVEVRDTPAGTDWQLADGERSEADRR